MDNKGENECVNLKENNEDPITFWKLKVKKNLRYDGSIHKVDSLRSFTRKNYFKIFVTLMDKDARGIVPSNYLRGKIDRGLKNEYFLRDDGSDDILIVNKHAQEEVQTFKMISKPLKISDDIDIFILPMDEAKQTKFFIEGPRVKYYKMNTKEGMTLIFSDEKENKTAEVFYLNTLLPNIPLIKTCNTPFPNLYATFDDKKQFQLKYMNEKKTFPRFVNVIESRTTKPLKKCIDDVSQLKYEFEKYPKVMKFSWNFNSKTSMNEIKLQSYSVYLTETNVSQPSMFIFKSFDYPIFIKRSVFISISKVLNQSNFKIQGVYFEETSNKGVIIHPEKDNLSVEGVPKDLYFNKDYSFFKKTLEPTSFLSQTVNYLSDDEIVYNIKNECSEKYTPTLKLSDDKKVIVDCVWIKNFVPFSTADSINNNAKHLKKGIATIISQLSLIGKEII